MDGSALAKDQQALLVDSLKAADRAMNKAQARRAQLMVEFADTRKRADRHHLAELASAGAKPRYKPGEFASMEVGLAVTATKHAVQQEVTRARRLQAEAPDAWDAWIAGDINEAKAAHISHALRKLVRDDSKRMLNLVVVEAAVRKTPELLRRWLNRFIARVEPDLSDERIRRSLEDRYVSVRPDLDGVSFLSACLPSLDAAAVDLVLDALVGIAEPGDPRTKQQRRADAMVDLLLGRISNGWPPGEGEGEPQASENRVDHDGPGGDEAGAVDEVTDDGDLPAGAFRPDPSADEAVDPPGGTGRPPPQVTIGVVVSIQSLFGFTDTPGELSDGSAHVPAAWIRELAGQPGTLFHRLLTDPTGNLLDVTEMGRFPSRKLAAAIRFRDGVCTNPVCHVAGHRCDLDHVVPWPDGPTAADNLGAKCRNDHRAKTHGGFATTPTDGQTSWTTPTGHRYAKEAEPLPVEEWPPDTG